MEYKVAKKLYCPVACRRFDKGEMISIDDNNLDSYKGYIEIVKVEKIDKNGA